MNKRVILGLSGGVDSTAAALLLKEKELEVIGFYFDVTGKNEDNIKAAKEVSNQLGIRFIHEDVSEEFKNIVIANFCNEYMCGRTPNPCVICNPNIKFKKLIETADSEGADYIATGHYARVCYKESSDAYFVQKGINEKKDQSYMLYRLGQNILSRLILPLGEIEDKEITRDIARKYGLSNAENADSQEICFIDEGKENYIDFIKRNGLESRKGKFINSDGRVLGEHRGLIHYTIGQRKGLGITLGKPIFVTAINAEDNTVTLGSNEDLFKNEVISTDNFFAECGKYSLSNEYVTDDKLSGGVEITAKIRYAAKPAKAILRRLSDEKLLTRFDEPQRAATPGQSIVFYRGNILIGGGIIMQIK